MQYGNFQFGDFFMFFEEKVKKYYNIFIFFILFLAKKRLIEKIKKIIKNI